MELQALRKLIIRLCIEGDLSVCDTCKNNKLENHCPYYKDNRCTDDNLAYYEPDERSL